MRTRWLSDFFIPFAVFFVVQIARSYWSDGQIALVSNIVWSILYGVGVALISMFFRWLHDKE